MSKRSKESNKDQKLLQEGGTNIYWHIEFQKAKKVNAVDIEF